GSAEANQSELRPKGSRKRSQSGGITSSTQYGTKNQERDGVGGAQRLPAPALVSSARQDCLQTFLPVGVCRDLRRCCSCWEGASHHFVGCWGAGQARAWLTT